MNFNDLEKVMFEKNLDMFGLDATVNNKPIRCFFKEIKESNFDKDYKYIFTPKDVEEGDYIRIKNDVYLALQNDNNFNDIYNRFITTKCNNVLKFKYADNKTYEIPCVITNNLPNNNDNPNNIVSWDTSKTYCLVSKNANKVNVIEDKGQNPTRFILGKNAWKTINIDNISKNNVYLIVLEQNVINTAKDDLKNEIAYNEWNGELNPPTEPDTKPEEKVMSIIGKYYIYNKRSDEYSIENNDKNLEFTWSIDNTELATIDNVTNGICTIKSCDKEYGQIILTAKNNEIELQKIIKITNYLSGIPTEPEPIPPCKPTPPTITLIGDKEITLEYGADYKDEGVTIIDDKDKDIKPIITYTKDGESVTGIITTIAGTYIIHYNALDTAGNKALEIVRTVIVKDKPLPTTLPYISNNLYYYLVDSDFTLTIQDNVKNEDYILTILEGEHRIKSVEKIDKGKFKMITTKNRGKVHFRLESDTYIVEVVKIIYRYGDDLTRPADIATIIK